MRIRIAGKEFEVGPEPADFWGWVDEGRYNTEWAILDRFLHASHTFVDLGAWVGSHSLYASTLCKEVISIEPDPVAYPILQTNILPLPNIQARRIAIGLTHVMTLGSGYLGASTTRSNPHAGGGIGPWAEGQTFEIEAISLRDLCNSLPDPLFLKIDIEGGEEALLQDMEFFVQRRPTIFMELHPFWWRTPLTWDRVHELMALYPHTYDRLLQPPGSKPLAIIMEAPCPIVP